MSFVLGIFVLLWILLGIIILGFILYNIFQKGHKPMQVLPILLVLIIIFGISAISIYYHATQAAENISTSSNASKSNSNPSSGKNNLYK